MEKVDIEMIRHSTAHLLAHAIKKLYPKALPTIGPIVENGFYYDFDNLDIKIEDFPKIEEEMKKIVKQNLDIKRIEFKTKEEAKKKFKDNKYKLELIDSFEEGSSAYEQGDFIDLCRGPHVAKTGMLKAFKLTKLSGAYWKGDQKNKMLTRVYGIAFATDKELKDYLLMLEEAEKRDHRKLGRELGLISFHEESPGAVFYHPKGTIIYNELQTFLRAEYFKRGFSEVVTPLVYDKSLWETSGHWGYYKENMFVFNVDGKEVSLKPMNCPSHCLIYKTDMKSYRDLPLRIADFAPLHRNELKGVLGGMMRVRKFCQDDAHIFCALEQLDQELDLSMEFAKFIYKDTFHFDYTVELSTRPEKSMGETKQWEAAENALKQALKKHKIDYKINPGDGAFYGPKIDFHIKDCLGREWQLATIQVDFQLPLKFGLEFEGKDGKRHVPVMIHRAILGSLDRFIGILIENYAGKFPLWLAPEQARILTISEKNSDYAHEVKKRLFELGIRASVDDSANTINKKVREAQVSKVPLCLTVGDKEMENKTVAIRTLDGKVKFGMKVSDFAKHVKENIEARKLEIDFL